MLTPSWSLIRSKESMRFNMKTWYLVTMQPSNWLTHLMASLSAMYLAFKYKDRWFSYAGGYIGLTSRYQLHLTVTTHRLFCLKHIIEVIEVYTASTNFEPRDWQFSIINYALHDILPNDPKEAASIRRKSPHFYYDLKVKTLYRYSYDGVILCSLSNSEA